MARVGLHFRIGETGKTRLEKLAADEGVETSAVIRACIAVALNRMDDLKRTIRASREEHL